MWGRYAPAVHINMLISLDTFKKYRYSDIITGRTNVTEYDCDKTQYSDGISDKMVSDRIKYMSLFVAETPEEISITFILYGCVILKKCSRDTGIFWHVFFFVCQNGKMGKKTGRDRFSVYR